MESRCCFTLHRYTDEYSWASGEWAGPRDSFTLLLNWQRKWVSMTAGVVETMATGRVWALTHMEMRNGKSTAKSVHYSHLKLFWSVQMTSKHNHTIKEKKLMFWNYLLHKSDIIYSLSYHKDIIEEHLFLNNTGPHSLLLYGQYFLFLRR